LGEKVKNIPGVDPNQVTSIATEKNIVGTIDGMAVSPFYEMDDFDSSTPQKVKQALDDFEIYQGNLVSKNGKMALIVAELMDADTTGEKSSGSKVYNEILTIVEHTKAGGNEIHVAGVGAVQDELLNKIDADAKRLNPFIALVITLILILAYRTFKGAFIPNILVMATAIITIGIMAGTGVEFFVITNALPPILIAIAVADSIHVFGQYYEEIRDTPGSSKQEIIVRTMAKIWRPVMLTSITTISGFLGLAVTASMPPFAYFGYFAAIGVLVALIYSFFFLPAALMLGKIKPSSAFGTNRGNSDVFSRFMDRMGQQVVRNPRTILAVGALVVIIGITGALQLKVNDAPIDSFKPEDAIAKADKIINDNMHGTSLLDIVVETKDIEGLYKPEHLKKIEKLQNWVVSLPYVNGSTSIVDILKKMNQSLNENQKSYYKIPDDEVLVAQEFFLYSASGDPADFEKYVDYDFKTANIRVSMNSSFFQDKKVVVNKVQDYINKEFNDESISASLSGSVALDYEWIKDLGTNHFFGASVALLLILLVSALTFRSLIAGVYAVFPVVVAILLIYAVMGYSDIWLGLGTTMFAAIAIGLGVDFSIHTIDRLIFFIKDQHIEKDKAFSDFYKSTGRALLFNLLALALGFSVMLTSSVVPLIQFSSLLIVAVSASFLSSMTILPAIIYLTSPKFLKEKQTD
ncbi:MMPL family transporter, partial [Bacteroidales bacterium AH-315-I05]|nr:MMPL family transporter [Bacteroidales bacterium AH-315-I05]